MKTTLTREPTMAWNWLTLVRSITITSHKRRNFHIPLPHRRFLLMERPIPETLPCQFLPQVSWLSHSRASQLNRYNSSLSIVTSKPVLIGILLVNRYLEVDRNLIQHLVTITIKISSLLLVLLLHMWMHTGLLTELLPITRR
jgi:hypothetical protein